MFRLRSNQSDVFSSRLYDQDSFYGVFIKDLNQANQQVIIESPFISPKRMLSLMSVFRSLRKRGVQVVINTKPPEEHDCQYAAYATAAINQMQALGITVLFTVGHHRKLAIIDERLVWEGSLNILSQNDSCEIMRRIQSPSEAVQMIEFLKIKKFII